MMRSQMSSSEMEDSRSREKKLTRMEGCCDLLAGKNQIGKNLIMDFGLICLIFEHDLKIQKTCFGYIRVRLTSGISRNAPTFTVGCMPCWAAALPRRVVSANSRACAQLSI